MEWMQNQGPPVNNQIFGNGYYHSYNTPAMAASVPSHHHHQPNHSADLINNNSVECNNYPMQGFTQPSTSDYGYGMPSTHNINQQQSPLYIQCQEYPMMSVNNTRHMRNMAEKMRRDRLNTYITQLGQLVPQVASSPKRLDKTSVLRLSTTFLRLHHLTKIASEQLMKLPVAFKSAWPQSLLEDTDGIMMIVTSAGKIVFVSNNVEKVLGHTQLELFGQSLSTITFPEDLEELQKALTSDEEPSNEADYDSEDSGVSSSESISTRGTSVARTTNKSVANVNENYSCFERQRRSFYLRLRHRCLARSEQPQYEQMHIVGYLQVPKKYASQAHKKTRKSKIEMSTATSSNDILLVAVMKPTQTLISTTVLAVCQEEYVTRHLWDGTILYSDHRISTIAGYLPSEVMGEQAFKFMHVGDVNWAAVALKSMLETPERFGQSCYRLRTKTGDFIYLISHGYFEPSADEKSSTFICINRLLSEEEGKREVQNMISRYSAEMKEIKQHGAGMTVVSKKCSILCSDRTVVQNEIIESKPLSPADQVLRSINIPIPLEPVEDPEKSKEIQFVKAKFMSKTIPITSGTVSKIIEEKSSLKANDNSSQSPSTSSTLSPTIVTPSSPPVYSRTTQNRPSVLCRAPPSQKPTPYTNNDTCITSTSQECLKQEAANLNGFERAGVVRRLDSVSNGNARENDRGVVVQRGSLKRSFDESFVTTVPIKKSPLSADSSQMNLISSERSPYDVSLKIMSVSPIQNDDVTQLDDFATNLSTINDDHVVQFGNISPFETKSEPEEVLQLLDSTNDDIKRSHIKLATKMHMQGVQINAIEGDLDKVSFTREQIGFQSNLTILKEQHVKQRQLLMTLKQDHHSLQSCDTDVNNRGMKPNIGV